MASPEEFRIGVCVTLKSGGPKMVIYDGPADSSSWISGREKYPMVKTVWFDGGECRTGDFLIACLNLAPE